MGRERDGNNIAEWIGTKQHKQKGSNMSIQNISSLFDEKRYGRTGRRSSIIPENSVAMSVQKAGRDKGGTKRKSLVFVVDAGLMRQQRWVLGDRVTIDFDAVNSEVTIRRVPEKTQGVSSWRLHARNTNKNQVGSAVTSHIKIVATPAMLRAFGMDDADGIYIPETCASRENGITFPMRKRWDVQNRTAQ